MKNETWRHWARRGLWLLLPAWMASLAPTAQAVPAYARQTGSDCVACHIAGVGPHLTPHGIWFKMNGYTEGEGKSARDAHARDLRQRRRGGGCQGGDLGG